MNSRYYNVRIWNTARDDCIAIFTCDTKEEALGWWESLTERYSLPIDVVEIDHVERIVRVV